MLFSVEFRLKMLTLVLFVFVLQAVSGQDNNVLKKYKIGAIFYEGSDALQTALAVSAGLDFEVIFETVKVGEILEVHERVCGLAEEGIVGVIDATRGRASQHVQAVCDMLELPHVIFQHNDLYSTTWSLLNMYPSTEAFNTVLTQLLEYKRWENFTLLYVKGHSIEKVSSLLTLGNETDRTTVTVQELSGVDYRDVLTKAKDSGFTNYVVDCPSENLEMFLLHAQQVGMMGEEYSFIFLSPDLFTLDLTRYRYGGVNITGFRLIDLRNENLWNFTAEYGEKTSIVLEAEQVKTDVMLLHDAIEVFRNALEKVQPTAQSVSCEEFTSWESGSSLLNFMKTNKVNGLTRLLNFDGFGQRTNVKIDIVEMTPAGNQTVGYFNEGILKIDRPFLPTADLTGESIMRNKTFKILIATTPPYGYTKLASETLQGNDRYEGFSIDLIEKVSEMLGFSYEFEVENTYGAKTQEGNVVKWNGMIQKIMEEKADFGICDFTVTAERQSAIDFSVPFMTLGIGILYKMPSKQPPELFSFMAVFSKEVWLSILFVQIGLGIIMIFVGRISSKEWQNPVPCIEQPEELSNQFSFANSVWLIIGSVMQQGSEIAPIAIGPRMIASVWWFFTMVIVASYTGTLVASLTVETDLMPFNNVQELARSNIKYGAKAKGSTISFFESSYNDMFKEMYRKMKENGWLVKDNDVGVTKVENGNYACFMESTSIEYYSERHCDLMAVGGLLDSKSYGIGMKKGSEYKRYIDDAILRLKENGEIQKMKDMWWKEKRGGGICHDHKDEEPKQLSMKNMAGAFVVLGGGCGLGLLISIIDMLWGVFKRSIKYNTTYKEELVQELKFALKFSGDVKPVRRKPANDSSEALSVEAKDELRSLRSGRSTDTHRTHHSHSSKHSSRSQSVAFAKMRKYD